MLELNTFEDAIRFAIKHEEEEAKFYEGMADRSRSADQKKALLNHAAEEYDHKRRLEAALANRKLPTTGRIVADPDMKIAELLVVEDRGDHLGYEEALLLAAQREKKAAQFYKSLAKSSTNSEMAEIFSFLAEQEVKHGKQMEQEYDDAQREG